MDTKDTNAQFAQPSQHIGMSLDSDAHWDIRNPLNIIPLFILLVLLLGVSALITSLIYRSL